MTAAERARLARILGMLGSGVTTSRQLTREG
jgi:hypothetical protein